MITDNLKDIKIAILGFGKEGQSLYDYLCKNGLTNVFVVDEKNPPEFYSDRSFDAGKFINKPFAQASLDQFDLIFRSPGVPYNKIISLGVNSDKLTSVTDFFLKNAICMTIGVTGTKGKSTTVKIIEKILKQNGRRVVVGGNIGLVPLEALDSLSMNDIVLLEMSSFQLEGLGVSPNVAVILPIDTDHLDYHANRDEYVEAKKAICSFQKSEDLTIFYNSADSSKIASSSPGNKISYSMGHDESSCQVNDAKLICMDKQRGLRTFENLAEHAEKYKIPLVDIVCAATLAYAMNLDFVSEEIFEDFEKLPLRIEYIKSVDGISFYNDSASTNPISTIEAVRTLREPFYLIAGGSSKGLNFQQMAKELSDNSFIRGVYLTGETANEIKSALLSAKFIEKIVVSPNLNESVRNAFSDAKNIGVILFSPASASFDNFSNYRERGEVFNEIVKNL